MDQANSNKNSRERRSRSGQSGDSGPGQPLPFPESGWTRTPPIFDKLDGLTEILIYISIVFSPWAFGTTQSWSISTMNYLSYGLGILLFAKWCIRIKFKYVPHRWGFSDSPKSIRTRVSKILTVTLAVLTGLILLFCLISAVNSRATFNPAEDLFIYNDNYIASLPHSYDGERTWNAFFSTLALACFFWSLRDWVLGKTRNERHDFMDQLESGDKQKSDRFRPRPLLIPDRFRRLMWVIAGNTFILALVSIVQRLDGGNKLLWLVEPIYGNKTNEAQFGPYAYRSNAAQYLNLAWPVCLGFWWASSRAFVENFKRSSRVGQGSHVVLLPMAVIIAVAPLVATSRGGVLISLASSVAALILFVAFAQRTSNKIKAGIIVLFSCIIGLGFWLGWEPLQKRLFASNSKFSTQAKEVYSTELTVKTVVDVPPADKPEYRWLPSLTPIQTIFAGPHSILARIHSNGSLQVYMYGRTPSDYVMKTVPDFVAKYSDQKVTLQYVKSDDLEIYANETLQESTESMVGNAPSWSDKCGVIYLWNGLGASSKGAGGYIHETEIYNKAMTPSDIELAAALATPTDESGLIYQGDFTGSGFFDTLSNSSSGRDEIYTVCDKMLEDFPLFGTGPGSFGFVNALYHESSYQHWHAYAHDDYREMLATYGYVGSAIVVLMVVVVLLHWLIGAGITQYFPFAALVMISIFGLLAHARYDFPFQVYSVIHMFVLNTCILSCIARRV